MSETNPLREMHESHDAEWQAYDQVQIVSTYGHPQAEYAAIHNRCAVMDWPQRGIIELTGRDRLSFLSNLVTNFTWDKDAKSGLEPGQGVYAFFLNTKGRIVADVNILERGDRTLLELDGRKVSELMALLDKYHFAEQVKITSRVGMWHELALFGPRAAALLGELSGAQAPALEPLGSTEMTLLGRTVQVWRDDITGTPGYWLILDAQEVAPFWAQLLAEHGEETEPGKRPVRPVGWAAFNATRIEAGRALFGIDFDETVLPVESGQFDRGVSVTKGCYLGQEIVARMHARNQVPRQVVGIRMEDDALPIAGAQVFDEKDNAVGAITSSTMSPVLSDVPVCLGFLKRGFFTPGTKLTIPAEGAMHVGTVVPLPFFKAGDQDAGDQGASEPGARE